MPELGLVYSSDMNMYVYDSDQNRASNLLKVTGTSHNVCVDYTVSPLSDK